MAMTKLKLATAVLVTATFLAAGIGTLAHAVLGRLPWRSMLRLTHPPAPTTPVHRQGSAEPGQAQAGLRPAHGFVDGDEARRQAGI